MLSIEQVVDFIDARKCGTGLEKWTKDQIGVYVIEATQSHTIQVVWVDGQVTGVVIFQPHRGGMFWIDQIWTTNRHAMKLMLLQLVKLYPLVEEVWGQRGSRRVKFKLKHLIKIYGR